MTYIKRIVMKGFKSFARETEMHLDRHVNVIVGPNGSGKSCHYSTKVTLANGQEIQIGKLIEDQIKKSNQIKTLKDGVYTDNNNNNNNNNNSLEIISLNKNTGKTENKKISKFIKRDGEIIYKIKTRTGKEVKATGCHPVMTFKNGEIKSVLIRDIDEDSLIATPRKIDIKPDKQYPLELARLIGYIIGDGYLAHDRIEFVNQDKEVINDFKQIINKFFPKAIIKERYDKNATRIYIRDKKFLKQIKNMFIKNHKESITSSIKKIPDLLLRTNNKIISQVLAGLYDTDGSVRKDIAIIEFCTKNKKLAEQMQGLLLRFGIISKIKKRLCCASNTKNKIKREYYYLYIYGMNNLQKFYENIQLRIKYKKEIIKSHLSKKIKTNPNLDLLPKELNFQIKKIVQLLGIKAKLLRKKYPFLMAYLENRCLPTRQGIKKLIPLFNEKISILESSYNRLVPNQLNLVTCMNLLNISGQSASQQIGLNKTIIRRDWATNRFNATNTNLNKFYNLIKNTFELRFMQISKIINTLQTLANSDIYWDKIISIEKLSKEEYVYDLTIDDNHNFIANNIFVHNSNVTDALCFVLGRLSIKSMRAAKASHLIFSGNKQFKRAKEADVEIVFDNSEKTFALESKEIKIKRIVKKTGQSIYKINNETKTRQEVLELLSQAGIDPHGFNIVLQGEIEKFVKMPGEDRRKVIEEVAGISVYEMRKSKSLKELDKTEARLKQISAILRERTKYLQNLENEREQALRFKKLELTVKKCKASIITKNLQERQKQLNEILKNIDLKKKETSKKQEIIEKTQNEITTLNEKANNISKQIQKSSGLEQNTLTAEISSLKQEIAGMSARKENFESQLNELNRRKQTLQETIKTSEKEIEEMSKQKGTDKKKDLQEKKQKLEELDELKRKSYLFKSNISSLNTQVQDKKTQIQRLKNESNFILNQIEHTEAEIKINEDLDQHQEALIKLKNSVKNNKQKAIELQEELITNEKIQAIQNQSITHAEKIKSQVSKLDICPLCKTKMTKEHINEVLDNSNTEISKAKITIQQTQGQIKQINENLDKLKHNISKQASEINKREIDIIKLQTIDDKKQQLKRNNSQINIFETELKNLENKKKNFESKQSKIKLSEEQYETLKLEVNELHRSEERNLGMEITAKQRELERIKVAIKQILRDREEIQEDLIDIDNNLEDKQDLVDEKQKQEQTLKVKYEKMFEQKNTLQDKARLFESNLLKQQNEKRLFENDINNLKINQAELTAKKDNLLEELKEFKGVEFINFSIDKLKQRLNKSVDILSRIGNVNLRALEVYDDIKEEYDKIKEKVDQLDKEKQEVLNIIAQIDKKKKKAFISTLKEINELFSRNFAQLSNKGIVTLEPQNKKEIFDAGLDITVKIGPGKHFDVTSLSGGEQTLVALSLIFAIQEHNPYCFYIFDEIDAALDRRNSEKLAYLLKKYMKHGQYLIITHNDSIISESSSILYGVSMQEGISKILSLEV